MILLLDIGNSRLKHALWDGTTLHYGEPVTHPAQGPAASLDALPAIKVQEVWVSHVVGIEVETRLNAAIERRYGIWPNYARSQAQHFGLLNAYREPRRLGVDRWLGMLAAWRKVSGPCLVASAGTALTVDAIDGVGRHLGGLIAPGYYTAMHGVLGATRFATRDMNARPHEGLGVDTEDCVRQGALLSCVGALQHVQNRLASTGSRLLIGGGDAALLLPFLGEGWQHEPHLVIEGLLALALEHKGR